MKKDLIVLLIVVLLVPAAMAQPQLRDPQAGQNPKSMTVYQIDPITVDGDLSDWPAGMEKRVCQEFYPSYAENSVALSTQENWFMVGWNDAANQLYVAGWSSDDVMVSQLSKWWNPDYTDLAGATWFYDRYEIYIEYDNDKTGAYGYAAAGNVQYAILANDPDRADVYGQETDANGNIKDVGTAFFITNYEAATADGRPPFSQAAIVFTPDDPNDPYGPYVKQFEAAITVLNFLEIGIEPDPNTDVVDLGPTMNDGRGLGFDVTMMDRDGNMRDTEDRYTANNQGAWIGWSEGSKNGHPEYNGTLNFSLSRQPAVNVRNWSLF
ncbi:MAG: hypothetical protein C4527_13535 [Candidatus Omnitrophota bacterium]|nr:MAG: hypothetical protein C4527_13535 [Candidatus Omnitrophota bacterium]